MAFAVMRALSIARLLWPQRAELSLGRLAGIADVTEADIEGAIALLCDEGVAVLDPWRGVVCLSERGARELLGGRSSVPVAASLLVASPSWSPGVLHS
jgi:hypothetical protein